MTRNFVEYSLVIVGKNHNPTILGDFFLKKSGIISSPDDIDRSNFLVTPAFTNIILKNGVSILAEPEKLNIRSNNSDLPFEIATKYCENLPFIKSTAIGFNFVLLLDDYDFDKWFSDRKSNLETKLRIEMIQYNVNVDNALCMIKVARNNDVSSIVNFNFHHEFQNIPLGDLNIDFKKLALKYKEKTIELINEII